MKYILHHSSEARAPSAWSESYGKKRLLRSEKKSVILMIGLVSKFCTVEDVALATCADIMATTKVFLQLREYRMFVGCGNNSACFQYPLPSLAAIYVKQVLSPWSDIVESEKIVDGSKVCLMSMEAHVLKRRVDTCTAPAGLVLLQTFAAHILHFLGTSYKHAIFPKTCRHPALLQLSDEWKGCLYSMDVDTLLIDQK